MAKYIDPEGNEVEAYQLPHPDDGVDDFHDWCEEVGLSTVYSGRGNCIDLFLAEDAEPVEVKPGEFIIKHADGSFTVLDGYLFGMMYEEGRGENTVFGRIKRATKTYSFLIINETRGVVHHPGDAYFEDNVVSRHARWEDARDEADRLNALAVLDVLIDLPEEFMNKLGEPSEAQLHIADVVKEIKAEDGENAL